MEYSFRLGRMVIDDFCIRHGSCGEDSLSSVDVAYEETPHLFVVTFNSGEFNFHGGSNSRGIFSHESLVRKFDIDDLNVFGGGCFFINDFNLFLTNYSGSYGAVPSSVLLGFEPVLKDFFVRYHIQKVVPKPFESKIRSYWNNLR